MRDAADVVWEEGYRQPFIRELGAGTLPRDTFAFYLIQDELYLNDYAKVHALAVTKTDDNEVMVFMAQVQHAIFHVEKTLHNEYLASFGITAQDMRDARQSAFARAYTANMLATAYGEDLIDILVAVLPCAWVYADYGQRLAREFAGTLTPTRTAAGSTRTAQTNSGSPRCGSSNISKPSPPRSTNRASAGSSSTSCAVWSTNTCSGRAPTTIR